MTFNKTGFRRVLDPFRKNRGLTILFLWVSTIPVLMSLFLGYVLVGLEYTIGHFDWVNWILFYALSVLTMSLAITPTTVIAIICGYFLGMEGLIGLVISYQLASMIGYFLAKRLDTGFVNGLTYYYPKSAIYFENVKKNQLTTTILARLSPALPFALMNVVLSTSGIRFVNFIFGGLLGMLPRTIFSVWLGSQAHFLNDALQNTDQIVWIIVISTLLIFSIYRVIKPK